MSLTEALLLSITFTMWVYAWFRWFKDEQRITRHRLAMSKIFSWQIKHPNEGSEFERVFLENLKDLAL